MCRMNHVQILGLVVAVPLSMVVVAWPASAATPTVTAPARFTVKVTGKGPDVILIPGLASSGGVWDATTAQLKAKHRVHVVQVAGFAGTAKRGNSSGPVLVPLVAELHRYIVTNKLSKPAVIGHSMGGLMALMLAADHGEAIGKVMVVDSLPWFGMIYGPTATTAAMQPRAGQMRDALIMSGQSAYAATAPATMARMVKSKTPAAQAAIAATAATDVDVSARALYDILLTDMRPCLASIANPVTMLYPWDASTGIAQTAFDTLYTSAYASVPNKTIKRIDGAYHFIMIDQPDAFGAEVKAFLVK